MATDADAPGFPPMVVNARVKERGFCSVDAMDPSGRPTPDGVMVASIVEFILGTDEH